jgi:hypothetical protein
MGVLVTTEACLVLARCVGVSIVQGAHSFLEVINLILLFHLIHQLELSLRFLDNAWALFYITTSMIDLASVYNYNIVLFILGIVSLIFCLFVAFILSFGGHLTIHLASFCFIKCLAISTTLIIYICFFLILVVQTNIHPLVVALVGDIMEFIWGNMNVIPFYLVWFIHLYHYEICIFL